MTNLTKSMRTALLQMARSERGEVVRGRMAKMPPLIDAGLAVWVQIGERSSRLDLTTRGRELAEPILAEYDAND